MSDYINFDDLFEEVDLPVPLSPLPPTPVSSPRPMSTAEIPELYFGKSVEESPERSLAETVAQSLEPCSTDPRAASPRPGPLMTKPTVVQRKTDPPHRKRSRSKEEKKSSKRRRTDERKSSDRPTSPEARPQDPRSPEARQHDPRSQELPRRWVHAHQRRRVLRFELVVRQDFDEMSHLHRHWYGMCHRCPIQGAISGLSKLLTHPVALEAPHPRDAKPWERG
ncbi:hypothetical protein NPIL_160981, partial [Nephila pilipes]